MHDVSYLNVFAVCIYTSMTRYNYRLVAAKFGDTVSQKTSTVALHYIV